MSVVAAALAEPTTNTVPRQGPSVRRTSHIDMIFGDGAAGNALRLRGRARDLYTDAGGSTTVLAEADIDGGLDTEHRLRSLTTQPAAPGVVDLLGLVVGSGFRSALSRAVGYDNTARAPLYLLLDDLPVAALISGYTFLFDGSRDDSSGREGRLGDNGARMVKADICSGWRSDGTMMVALRSGSGMPAPVGPPAPPLVNRDDPLGWHHIDDLAPASMRRRRLIDVTWGDPLAVHAMFRDTHKGADGVETVLHEYTVEATVDPSTRQVLQCEATPRALPWPECPHAAASASRLEGQPVGDLRDFVRQNLGGTTTCTHLNDLLRSLADVATLAAILGERVEP